MLLLILAILIIQILSKDTTVVEGNHFYSTYQLFTTYTVNSLKQDYYYAVILRPKEPANTNYSNSISMVLKSGSQMTECAYKGYSDLCTIKVQNPANTTMRVQCTSLPCQIYFTSYQIPVAHDLSKMQLKQLYLLQPQYNHVLLDLRCNDPNIKDFATNIKIYSNQVYKRTQNNNSVIVMFSKGGPGFVYVQATANMKVCTKLQSYIVNEILPTGKLIKDFVDINQSNEYKLQIRPQNDFRVDLSYRIAKNLTDTKPENISLELELVGELSGKQTSIHKYLIQQNKQVISCNLLFPSKSFLTYTNLKLILHKPIVTTLVQMYVDTENRNKLDSDQIGYYFLEPKQSITYTLDALTENDNQDEVLVKVTPSIIKVNQSTCLVKKGCSILLSSKEKVTQGTVQFLPKEKKIDKLQYVDIKEVYSAKIREDQKHYYIHQVPSKSEIEITVNSYNVIVYAGTGNCTVPSKQCAVGSGNAQNSIYFINQNQADQTLYIAVIAIDTASYTLRIHDFQSQFIQLTEGQPFTYNIQSKIAFKFTLPSKVDVDFNLIAPLNTLQMYINNEAESQPTSQRADYKSTQGLVSLKKKQIKSTKFIIVIQNVNDNYKKVHFTLIASTSNTILPLDPSITHYQTLKANKPKTYIVTYNHQLTNVINLYSTTANNKKINLDIVITNEVKKNKKNSISKNLSVTAPHQLIELEPIAEQICKNIENCDLYIKITNINLEDVELTITLLTQNAVIQLKDGIYQAFPLTVTTGATHFFFLPKHPNKTVNIIYNSTFKKLSVVYRLFDIEGQQYDTSEWPFPIQQDIGQLTAGNQVHQVSISGNNLEKCWPNCAVLLSLINLDGKITQSKNEDHFSIMATNDIIEIFEHERLQLVLRSEQEKQIMIDLKPLFSRKIITIFMGQTIGHVDVYASLSSNQKTRAPAPEEYDFKIQSPQTQIEIESIQEKMKELNMTKLQEIKLTLLVVPRSETKMHIEFSGKENLIKLLNYDSYENIIVQGGSIKILKFQPREDYSIKIVRTQGFPYTQIKHCKFSQVDNCSQQPYNLTQMATKTDGISGKGTSQQIILIIFKAIQKIAVNVYVLSKVGELEIKQGYTINDYINKEESMKYLITTLKQKQTIITVNVMEGNPKVSVTDNNGFNISSYKKNNIIHISIPPGIRTNITNQNLAHTSSFGLNDKFQHLHVTVEAQKIENTFYTITYNSGDRGIQLEDGLISTVFIEPNTAVTFFYINPAIQSQQFNVALTFLTPKQLDSAQIKLRCYNSDKQDQKQIVPEKPTIRKKTPHPTLIVKMPQGYKTYEIILKSSETQNFTVGIVVNHNELITLPYNIEYPLVIKQNEGQYLISEINNNGYILIVIRKCNEGEPTLYYSFNQTAVQKDDFTFQTVIRDQMRQQIFIKAEIGTLYMKLITQTYTVFSIEIKYFSDKALVPKDDIKLPNNGILDYQLINSVQSEVSFSPIRCTGQKKCPRTTYSYICSPDSKALYSQLVCPSNFFSEFQFQRILQFHQIKVGDLTSGLPIRFDYRLEAEISYVGVKATLQDGRQYYYKPVEIVTIWGHISRTQKYHNYFLLMAGIFLICCLCILIRSRRKGYSRLREEDV